MEKIEKKYMCDLCSKETTKFERIKYPVLFRTEQNAGTYTTPYISYEDLDLCEDCVKKAIKIVGTGAQGYNKYELTNAAEFRNINLKGKRDK